MHDEDVCSSVRLLRRDGVTADADEHRQTGSPDQRPSAELLILFSAASAACSRETVDWSCEVCKQIWCVIHDGAGGGAKRPEPTVCFSPLRQGHEMEQNVKG
ncbi:hypothetical protein EYF80_006166 [Liparis tanakae]|uniref:Uncharacterized protein n=1 Tax=Liparis tanakae TaxID=230148 RepID=A0A4Z2J1R8_9TELE|nr:hypothetical protein EYF80_006166 [Liparis tanakae]